MLLILKGYFLFAIFLYKDPQEWMGLCFESVGKSEEIAIQHSVP